MAVEELHVLVLAGGNSTRIRTGTPKALLDLCGRTVLQHVLTLSESFPAASYNLVLGGLHQTAIETWLQKTGFDSRWRVVEQEEPRGTGDAVRCALQFLPESGQVMVLCGDTPLLTEEILQKLLASPGGALLAAEVQDPHGYGRIVRNSAGGIDRIVEQADCDAESALIHEINAGVYVLDLGLLRRACADLSTQNAQGELYLTDAAVNVLQQNGGGVICLEGEEVASIQGINTLQQLAEANAAMRRRILHAHMSAGVIVTDPASAFVDCDVEIGPGTQILPFCVIRAGTRIGKSCVVGPFAHLRGATRLHDGAEIGNFVEAKKVDMGAGAKAKHLTYLGDAIVGSRANIGCGTITANYDGKNKHQTEIGERAFVGSGTVLVAPVRVGKEATTGAGAIVTRGRDVADGETVVGVPAKPLRSKQH